MLQAATDVRPKSQSFNFLVDVSYDLFIVDKMSFLIWHFLSRLCVRVIDNLKDYAVKALVNAVDHLGTVSYKLTDIIEQQTLDVSMMELKVSCLDQRLLTCQTYIDHEGLRQQQLLAMVPKLHKHYTLPGMVMITQDKQLCMLNI